MDVPKSGAATKPDDSRLSPFSRMLKQPKADSGRSPAGPARKSDPETTAAPRSKPRPVATSKATVGATITIKGDIAGEGDVFVSGTVEGTIDLPGNRVIVEGTGRVKGSIVGKQVEVKGKVVGDIEAVDKLSITSVGAVRGTVIAPRLAVEDGAKFKGRIEMDADVGPEAAGQSKK